MNTTHHVNKSMYIYMGSSIVDMSI